MVIILWSCNFFLDFYLGEFFGSDGGARPFGGTGVFVYASVPGHSLIQKYRSAA